MALSDVKLQEWIEALAAEGCDRRVLGDLEADCIGRAGRIRMVRDRAIRDMEAARLLPKEGADVIAIRQGCHRATAYRRAGRAIVALRLRDATNL